MGTRQKSSHCFVAVLAGLLCGIAALPALAAGPATLEIAPSDYARAREALVESIEDEGLVIASVSGFGAMLERTEPDLGHHGNIYRDAEVFAFCSVRIAARLALENPDNIALCPLSIGIYELKSRPGIVRIVYRAPGTASPGDRDALELLGRIAERAQTSARISLPGDAGPR